MNTKPIIDDQSPTLVLLGTVDIPTLATLETKEGVYKGFMKVDLAYGSVFVYRSYELRQAIRYDGNQPEIWNYYGKDLLAVVKTEFELFV